MEKKIMPTRLMKEFSELVKAYGELRAAKREALKLEREGRKLDREGQKIERESANLKVFLDSIFEADKIKDPVLRKKATALAAACP